jgi:hypothetical protein
MSAHAAVTQSVAGADRENRREFGVMAANNLWDDAACRDVPSELMRMDTRRWMTPENR